MPIVSRSRLRQMVGQSKLRDTYVGTTVYSPNPITGTVVTLMDPRLVNTALSGQAIGQGWTFRLTGVQIDYQVASYNVASGALISGQLAATTVGSGSTFEVSRKVRGEDKDRAIDGIVARLWSRQELPLDTNGALQYSIGRDFKVFDAYYFVSPTGTVSRDQHNLPLGWNIAVTGSGRELRLPAGTALGASQQIILDAQVRATLGAADTATVNIPDEDWVLNGVAARCYQTLWSDAPGKEAGKYKDLAQAYGLEFVKKIGKYRDRIDSGWRGAFDEWVG